VTDDSLPAGFQIYEDNEDEIPGSEPLLAVQVYDDRYDNIQNYDGDETQPQHAAGFEGKDVSPLLENTTLSSMGPSVRVYPDQQRIVVEARAVDRDPTKKGKRAPRNRAHEVTEMAAKGLDKKPRGEARIVDSELEQREGPGEAWGNTTELGLHQHWANLKSSCSTHRRPSR